MAKDSSDHSYASHLCYMQFVACFIVFQILFLFPHVPRWVDSVIIVMIPLLLQKSANCETNWDTSNSHNPNHWSTWFPFRVLFKVERTELESKPLTLLVQNWVKFTLASSTVSGFIASSIIKPFCQPLFIHSYAAHKAVTLNCVCLRSLQQRDSHLRFT